MAWEAALYGFDHAHSVVERALAALGLEERELPEEETPPDLGEEFAVAPGPTGDFEQSCTIYGAYDALSDSYMFFTPTMPYAVQPMLRSDGGAFWCDYDLYARILERIGGVAAAGLSSVGVNAPVTADFAPIPCHPAAFHLYDPELVLNSLNHAHPHSPLDGLPDHLLANLLRGPHYGSPHSPPSTPESSLIDVETESPCDSNPIKAIELESQSIDVSRFPIKLMQELIEDGIFIQSKEHPEFVVNSAIHPGGVVTCVFQRYQNTTSKIERDDGASIRVFYPDGPVCYRLVARFDYGPEEYAGWGDDIQGFCAYLRRPEKVEQYADYALAKVKGQFAEEFISKMDVAHGVVNFIGHATPLVGTTMYLIEGERGEAAISLVGDISLFVGVGIIENAAKAGKGLSAAKTGKGLSAAKTGVVLASNAVEFSAGIYRGYQGWDAWQRGEKLAAGGYFSEAFLRMLGVSKKTIQLIKLRGEKAAAALKAEATLEKAADAIDKAPINRIPSGLKPLVSDLPELNWNGTRILGIAQETNTDGHVRAIAKHVQLMSQSGDYEYITLNRSWKVSTSIDGAAGNLRPDIISVRWDGTVDAVEVMSKGDTYKKLRDRLEEGRKSLPQANRGDIHVIPYPYNG
ncbi:MAG: hypothetical protein IT426_17400 [Pirellulales bacterium]|nr:hypothetical protein [Pirellulales bacterium]